MATFAADIGPTVLTPFVDGPATRVRFEVDPRPARLLPHVDGVLAGAAEADITPPPGMPKAGYSANAHDGSGFRTRLRARVTHLRAGTASLALVQLDLLGGSSVLQHLVAEAVADRTDIPLAGIWIGATHTHAGPGQFLGTDFYNHHASNRAGVGTPTGCAGGSRGTASAVVIASPSWPTATAPRSPAPRSTDPQPVLVSGERAGRSPGLTSSRWIRSCQR